MLFRSKTIQEKLSSFKVLIIEDDIANMYLLEKILKILKIEYYKAYDGATALEIFEKNQQIDFVLMDIRLPDINGYELTKRMKAIRAKTIIIAQTAYAMDDDRNKCANVGCDDFISKPFTKKDLSDIFQKYLK